MIMRFLFFFIPLFLFLPSCKEKGCTDLKALNYEIGAMVNDKSCKYSDCVFYQEKDFYVEYPSGDTNYIQRIEVFVGSSRIGEPEETYPNGPGHCGVFGTVEYIIRNGEPIEWSSKIYFIDGTTRLKSGVHYADPKISCLKINATPN